MEQINTTDAVREILEEVHRAAGSDARVLISGDTAIGKEVIARRIHERSARNLGPFVAMTCEGVRSDLLEWLLFGHGPNSIDGTPNEVSGWLERADRGTLFIDEICDLDFRLQNSLLAFLETGTVRPSGAPPREGTADVRIIAGSSRNLHDEVVAGHFNETLFYRLNLIHIVLSGRPGRHEPASPPFVEEQHRLFSLELD